MLMVVFPGGPVGKESSCNEGDLGLILGLGRSLGEGNSYPLQYFCLENSMDGIVHGVTKSQTELIELKPPTKEDVNILYSREDHRRQP